jgi:hypothetical protein
MAFRKPHDLRVVFKVLGKSVVDAGANERECWFWCSKAQPPELIRVTYKDLARGKARWPIPIGPTSIPEWLGVAEHDPLGRYEVKSNEKMIELIEKTRSPQGEPIRKVTIFNRSPERPVVAGYRVEDLKGGVRCTVAVEAAQLDRASGATLPKRLRIDWPAEKVRAVVILSELRVNEVIERERAAKLFTPPERP